MIMDTLLYFYITLNYRRLCGNANAMIQTKKVGDDELKVVSDMYVLCFDNTFD